MSIILSPNNKIKLYKTILIDPAWPAFGGGKSCRGAQRHYPLIRTIPQIYETIIHSGVFNPSPNGCHLYMWSTNNFVMKAGWIIEKLGFDYITMITWPKKYYVIGKYFRSQTEQLLFSRKKPVLPYRSAKSSTLLPVENTKIHSAKPTSAYSLIESVSYPPYLEMFNRGSAYNDKWTPWGYDTI